MPATAWLGCGDGATTDHQGPLLGLSLTLGDVIIAIYIAALLVFSSALALRRK